ncbi:Type II secretion system core protein G [Sphingomonas antarctica]
MMLKFRRPGAGRDRWRWSTTVYRGPGLRRGDEDGFTLVELMVVIVIIGLLATIVAINVLPSLGKANGTKAKADIATLDQAVEHYRLDTNQYPSAEQGLRVLSASGGYIKKLPDDPWGRPYIYAFPGQHGAYDITSLGADGQPGGTGENADIGNWQ